MNIETLFEQTELGQVIKKAIEKHMKAKEKAKAKEEREEKEKHLVVRGRRQRVPKFTKEEQKIKKLACDKAYYLKNRDRLIQLNTDNYYIRREKEKTNKKTID
jgi:hypothetical protein